MSVEPGPVQKPRCSLERMNTADINHSGRSAMSNNASCAVKQTPSLPSVSYYKGIIILKSLLNE